MSQVSRGYFLSIDPLVDYGVEAVEAAAQGIVGASFLRHDNRQTGAKDAIVAARAEQGGAPAAVRHAVAMGAGKPFDEAVQPQAPQVVAHLALGHALGSSAEQRR